METDLSRFFCFPYRWRKKEREKAMDIGCSKDTRRRRRKRVFSGEIFLLFDPLDPPPLSSGELVPHLKRASDDGVQRFAHFSAQGRFFYSDHGWIWRILFLAVEEALERNDVVSDADPTVPA